MNRPNSKPKILDVAMTAIGVAVSYFGFVYRFTAPEATPAKKNIATALGIMGATTAVVNAFVSGYEVAKEDTQHCKNADKQENEENKKWVEAIKSNQITAMKTIS